MVRLINADDVMGITFKRYCKDCIKRKGKRNGKLRVLYKIGEAPCRGCEIDDMKSMIEDAPTVDAETVKRGKWVSHKENGYVCSVCGNSIITNPSYLKEHKFCFKCGAKMDGEEE